MTDEKTEKPIDPLVSVIIPAFNAERYIDQCLSSIEGQTYRNIEILLVDDGSTDETLGKVRIHAAADKRIKVLTQENRYAGVARNHGFSHSSGDYVLFLDADDFFLPDMIDCMVKRALSVHADVTVCRSSYYDDVTGEVKPIPFCLRYVDAEAVYSGSDLRDVMFRFCNGWPWDKLYRADFIRESGLAFQDLRTTNDAYFVFMSLILSERIAFADEALVMHRTNNGESLERTRTKSWDNAMRAALAIEDGMKRFGVFDTFERSYLNWFLSFSLWNFQTLSGEARDGFLEKMEELIAPRLPENPRDDFYFEECDAQAACLLRSERFEMLRMGLELAVELRRERDGIEYLRGWIDATEREVRLREQDIELLRQENEQLRESTTYKVGRAIMTVPCKVRDLLGRSEDE